MSIRTYRVAEGAVDTVMHRVDRDLAESFAREPGFVAYHVVQTGPRTISSVTIFHDRGQAQASNDLAAQWVADELSDLEVERLGVMGGEIMVSRAGASVLEPAHH